MGIWLWKTIGIYWCGNWKNNKPNIVNYRSTKRSIANYYLMKGLFSEPDARLIRSSYVIKRRMTEHVSKQTPRKDDFR